MIDAVVREASTGMSVTLPSLNILLPLLPATPLRIAATAAAYTISPPPRREYNKKLKKKIEHRERIKTFGWTSVRREKGGILYLVCAQTSSRTKKGDGGKEGGIRTVTQQKNTSTDVETSIYFLAERRRSPHKDFQSTNQKLERFVAPTVG